MYDGTGPWWDLFDQAGMGSPYTNWRGTREKFNHGVPATSNNIVPMPIKTPITLSGSVFRSIVLTGPRWYGDDTP